MSADSSRLLGRRHFIKSMLALSAAGLEVSGFVRAAAAPASDPARSLGLGWTRKLRWDLVADITRMPGHGDFWDERLEQAQQRIGAQGGGVVFFPAGEYRFRGDIRLRDGIILRGAEPPEGAAALDDSFSPPSRLEFPKYAPLFTGSGAPVEGAFRGIVLEDPAAAANCGVVHLALNRGYIALGEGPDHRCGANRLVYGCTLRNAAGVMAEVPSAQSSQPAWLRYTHKFRSAIRVHASENALVANNRIPRSGDDNFVMREYPLLDRRKEIVRFDVEFDYDNRPGIYVNHHCIGGAGGSGDDGTPETHPWGFRKGAVICGNYVFNTGRCAIGFSGDGVICRGNVIRFARGLVRPTVTGVHCSYGSSTNDNRALEMRGWRWIVEDNDYEVFSNLCSDKVYRINDGEGLMHEDHCNSTILDSRLVRNRGNSYLSLFHVGQIDGLHVEGNDISTPGNISDIYVCAPRHKKPGDFPIRRVAILSNTTRSNGIRVMGWPAERVVVRANRHAGPKPGKILNEAGAELADNANYEVSTIARKNS
ncbi:MAG TPA: hypothetical protein P5555_07105 [Candidatus Paceibacterota bacterium]|nr:hypothetical protein [Verrucomicrobiota bacterium]HOX02115.1 hypothetical protein [Verrucomicrobiota bacterium]HRZ44943.1 hypothetical protein [Candidatus Paceibacterota bacterium]HRZ92304.1 hypothetical protein [Candidatus Paceibacterota bacterium]